MTTFTLNVHAPAHVAVRQGLIRTSWASAKGLTHEQRETIGALLNGEPLAVPDIVATIVAALSANATRFGQSMARRQGRQPLLDLYDLLPESATVSAVEHAHRARLDGEQAAAFARMRNENVSLYGQVADLRRALQAAEASRPQAADVAAHAFALDLLTPEQRQRVSDFRTGYRAAQRG